MARNLSSRFFDENGSKTFSVLHITVSWSSEQLITSSFESYAGFTQSERLGMSLYTMYVLSL